MPEYQQGQTFLQYIQSNVDEINQFQQASFNWRFDNNGHELPIITNSILNHPEFAVVANHLPNVLSRTNVQNAGLIDILGDKTAVMS